MSSDSLDMNDYANSTLSFPQKLFILLEIDTSGLITWASHGMCFRIEDPDKFAEDIVPRYFKQTKLTSFQRQLNLYGFRRLSKGEDQGCYFHPKFQRNRKDLLSEIKRLPVKGSLQTYDQVMAAVHSLPSERFGSKRKQAPHTNTVADSQAEEHAVKRQATEQQNLPSASTAPSMIALAPSSMEINSTYPKMSKLTMNIGFAKFLENQKQNNLNKQIPPPRPEHLLRSQVQRQQQPIPPITEHQRDLLNFPIFSNFASERDDNTKTLTKRSSEASLFTPDDLDLLDFLEPIRHDIDIPSAEDDEYIPTFDEAILQNRLL